MLGPVEHHGKDTIQETLKTIGNAHVWLIQCCKSCANRYNIIDCEQSLFSLESRLGRTGESELANRETGERRDPSAFACFARFPHSHDHPEGLLAV